MGFRTDEIGEFAKGVALVMLEFLQAAAEIAGTPPQSGNPRETRNRLADIARFVLATGWRA